MLGRSGRRSLRLFSLFCQPLTFDITFVERPLVKDQKTWRMGIIFKHSYSESKYVFAVGQKPCSMTNQFYHAKMKLNPNCLFTFENVSKWNIIDIQCWGCKAFCNFWSDWFSRFFEFSYQKFEHVFSIHSHKLNRQYISFMWKCRSTKEPSSLWSYVCMWQIRFCDSYKVFLPIGMPNGRRATFIAFAKCIVVFAQ